MKKFQKKIRKCSLKLRNFFHYENCSICPPPSSSTTRCSRQVRKLRTTNSKIPDGISNITRKISVSSSSKVCGLFSYTRSLRYPHKKKSQTLRSGEYGSQNQPQWNKFGKQLEMTRLPNFVRRNSKFSLEVCGFALSCWKVSFYKCSRFSNSEQISFSNSTQ